MPKILPISKKKKGKTVPIGEAAKVLGVSIDTVRRWSKQGKLSPTRLNGKTRYFSLDELEKIKFEEPLTISEAAKSLRISVTTLRRLEKRKLIKPHRNNNNERVYTRDSLQKYIDSEYFLRNKKTEVSILEPVKEEVKKESDSKEKVKTEISVIGSVLKDNQKIITGLLKLKNRIVALSVFISVLVALLIAIITIIYLLFPEPAARFFGYRDDFGNSKITKILNLNEPKVLGVATESGSVLAMTLTPISDVSLILVRIINLETYNKIVRQNKIEDINDYFGINSDNNVFPKTSIYFPSASNLQIGDNILIDNLNAQFLQGKEPGTNAGNIVYWDNLGIILGLSVSASNLTNNAVSGGIGGAVLDDSLISSDIKDETITSTDLSSTLTFSNGDLINLSAIGHLTTSNMGLILPNTQSSPSLPSSGEGYLAYDATLNKVIYYNGSSWANIGGLSGTLNETISGSWTYSSITPISLSSISPSISIGNTGTLNITDGTNSLLTIIDNGTSGKVGIGTTTPAQALDVAGTIQTTGFKLTTSPVNGYVLTSDANGVGTWQVPSSGFSNPMTTQGDIIYGGASGTATRLAGSGSDGYVLKYNTTTSVPYWAVDTNTTYTAGNDIDLTGTQIDIESQLDYVSIISRASSTLALQTTTSGDITLTPAVGTGLINILTGNLKVGNGTPTVTQDGEDAYIEGTLEVDGTVRFDSTLLVASAITAPTSTNTINSLVINSGALSGITTLSMNNQLTSTLAIGTSPFAVTSTTVNTNLNADLLDGYHGSAFLQLAGGTMVGDILGAVNLGSTGTRILKLWATDITVTNTITGSITGNAGTVSTITGLAPDTATTQASQPNITSLGTLTDLTMSGNIVMGNNGTIGQADGPLLNFDNSNDYLEITGASVGIGTATPSNTLSVDGNGVWIDNPGNIGQTQINTVANATANQLVRGSIFMSRDGSVSWDGTYWQKSVDTDWTGIMERSPGDLSFYTIPSTTTFTNMSNATFRSTYERMVIGSTGNIGIGTTSPLELLSLGTAGTTAGVLSLAGSTSGKAIISVSAVAGTPTLTLPTSTGTLMLVGGSHTTLGDIGTNTHSTIDTHIGGTLAQHASTTSLQLAGVISNETGSGALMFGTSPTIITSLIMSDGATLGQTAGPLMTFDDTNNYLEITGANVGIGTATPGYPLEVTGDAYISSQLGIGVVPTNGAEFLNIYGAYNGFAVKIVNTGLTTAKKGIEIWTGRSDSGTNTLISFADYLGTEQGAITYNTGTVTYGAFTANHDTSIPEQYNASGYPYGTLLCIISATTPQTQIRNIQYQSEACDNGSYSNKVLGAYAGKYDDKPNLHQVYVLGDGHILVNGENGDINVGDKITTSSTTGIGMKADDYGSTFGVAQENYHFSDPNEVKLISVQYGLSYNVPNLALNETGNIILSGNSTSGYTVTTTEGSISKIGAFVEIVVADIKSGFIKSKQAEIDDLAIDTIKPLNGENVSISLSNGQEFIVSNKLGEPVITFDNSGNATFSGTITADKLIANKIEGLEILTDSITSLNLAYKELNNKVEGVATQSSQIVGEDNSTSSIAISDLETLKLNGGLTVSGPVEFKGESTFNKLSTFLNEVIFKGQVTFFDRVLFNSDTAGVAIIQKGSDRVKVNFEKSYLNLPMITANITLDSVAPENQSTLSVIEQEILNGDISYIVTNRMKDGFEIRLNKVSPVDIQFSWTSLGVTKTNKSIGTPIISSPTPIASPVPEVVEIVEETEKVTESTDSSLSLTILDNELGVVYIRDAQSTNDNIIGEIPSGTTINYSEELYGWYNINYNEIIGWVSGTYVKLN